MNILAAIGLIVLAFTLTAVLGLFSKWADRKVTARIHWRVGPPWFQPVADIVKLLAKEPVRTEEHGESGLYAFPIVSLGATILAAMLIWGANLEYGFGGDLLVVLLLALVPSLSMVAGGIRSDNPFVSIGAKREVKMLLAFVPPMLLALLVAAVKADTWQLAGMAAQGMLIGNLSCLIAFIVAIFCTQAALGMTPFDISEAETEIMDGAIGPYSGRALAVLYLTRAMLLTILIMVLVTAFLGGTGTGVLGLLWWAVKYVVVLVVLILIKNTNPRIRVDQARKFFWYIMTPLAAIMVCLALLGL